MRYEKCLNFLLENLHEIRIYELTNCERYHYRSVDYFLSVYQEFRVVYKEEFSKEDFRRIRASLPLAETIGSGIYESTSVPHNLRTTSAITFLIDDFAEMEDLKYHENVTELCKTMDDWHLNGAPFKTAWEYVIARNPFIGNKFGRFSFPDHHTWWNLWQGVTAVDGEPVTQIIRDDEERRQIK